MPMGRVLVQLPEEFLERIDAARGDIPRSAWIRRACEMRFGGSKRVWKGTAAEWAAFEEGAGLQPTYKVNISAAKGMMDTDPDAFAAEVDAKLKAGEFTLKGSTTDKLKELNAAAPIPCQCGGKIYQVGAKKGQCSRCTKPRPT